MGCARAGRFTGLAAALVTAAALLVAPGSVPAHAVDYKPWGKAWSSDKPLKRGCHSYYYRYRVDVPSDDWLVEIFLVNPDGVGLNHAVWADQYDPDAARRVWRPEICRSNTRFGRHKIKMKVTWREETYPYTERVGWVRPTYFRFYRPR